MTLTVAILGRPNVGKSTLFNRLVGRKIALVDDQPGVTRDRREGDARIGDLKFKIFDTAGLDEARRDTLEARMSAQAETAIGDADVVLFVVDARAGVTPTDKQFAEFMGDLYRMGLLDMIAAEEPVAAAGEADVPNQQTATAKADSVFHGAPDPLADFDPYEEPLVGNGRGRSLAVSLRTADVESGSSLLG